MPTVTAAARGDGFSPAAGRLPVWLRPLLAGAVALLAVLVLEGILWEIAYPLALVFGGVVIAQGLAPIVAWLCRYLPRPLAVAGLYLTILAAGAAAAWFFIPVLVEQVTEFTAGLPGLEAALRRMVGRWSPIGMDQIAGAAQTYLGRFSATLVELPTSAFAGVTNLVLVFFLSLYWLVAQPALRGWVLGLVPEDRRDKTRDVLGEVGDTIGGYVRGVLISAVSVAILTYLGLTLLGMPSTLVLAVLAGFGEFIPVLGPFIAAGPAVAVALATPDASPVLVLAFYIGLQQVESNVLVPLVMRGQAQIPPLLSLVAFLIGAAVGGIIGALIAIPLFGSLRVVAVRLLAPAERRLAGVSEAEARAVHHAEVNRPEGEIDDA